ncbi:unnamed protein product [Calypogeia fissa]
MDDSREYLKMVEKMLGDKDKYDEFKRVIKDLLNGFNAQRIGLDRLIAEVKHLLRGYPLLILGFNEFLPEGSKMTSFTEDVQFKKQQPVQLNQVVNYLDKVKTRFQSEEHIYKRFVHFLNMYHAGTKTIQQVYQDVAQLFTEHTDLAGEFICLFPDSTVAGPGSSIQIIVPGTENVASPSRKHKLGMVKVEVQSSKEGEKTAKRQKVSPKFERQNPKAPERVGVKKTQDGIPSSKPDKDEQKGKEKKIILKISRNVECLQAQTTSVGVENSQGRIPSTQPQKDKQKRKEKEVTLTISRNVKCALQAQTKRVRIENSQDRILPCSQPQKDERKRKEKEVTQKVSPNVECPQPPKWVKVENTQDRMSSKSKLQTDERKGKEKEPPKSSPNPAPERVGDKIVGDKITQDRLPASKFDKDEQIKRKEKEIKLKSIIRKKVLKMVRQQSQGGEGGENMHDQSRSLTVEDGNKLSKNGGLQEHENFFNRVKETFYAETVYEEILKCFFVFKKEVINRSELGDLISYLLGKHSHLVEEFNNFILKSESLHGYIEGLDLSSIFHFEEEFENELLLSKVRKRIAGFVARSKVPAQTPHPLLNQQRVHDEPISGPHHSNWELCTPSYRLRPNNHPNISSTHHTELALSVLNNSCVSTPAGYEDYSSKQLGKNQGEESLLRCEEDRFELDLLLLRMADTACKVTDLLKYIQDQTFKQDVPPFVLERHLSAINLRCIERIYGDHGVEMVDLIRTDPSTALPVVLTRLLQKQKEWSRQQIVMNKVWKEVSLKNCKTATAWMG